MQTRLSFVAGFIATLLLLVAGCGGGSSTPAPSILTVKAEKPSLAAACAPGRSYMGCSLKSERSMRLAPALLAPPHGLEFPDVSEFQGSVNWGAVAGWQRAHGWHPYAIFKMGEYRADNFAARNAQQLAALGFYRAGYWFLRATGCSHEEAQILAAAHAYNLKVVVLDDEVPEARGYAACLAPPLKRVGLIVIEYTSPGSNPDSRNPGLDEWVAAFGPSAPPCVFTCNVAVPGKQSILAWQFTDGQFGPVVDIPGIGRDDVSVSYGIDKLGAPAPPPPPPACYHHHISTAACKAAKAKVARYQAEANKYAWDVWWLDQQIAKIEQAN